VPAQDFHRLVVISGGSAVAIICHQASECFITGGSVARCWGGRTGGANLPGKSRGVSELRNCALPAFWNMNRPGHALIYPAYLPSNTSRHIELGHAASDWDQMLYRLGRGDNITTVLITGNSSAVAQGEQLRWTYDGDPNVEFPKGTP
jgi:hypothetical protein